MALSLKEKLKLALGDKTKEPLFNQGFTDSPALRTGPSVYGATYLSWPDRPDFRSGPGNHGLNDKTGRIRIDKRTRN